MNYQDRIDGATRDILEEIKQRDIRNNMGSMGHTFAGLLRSYLSGIEDVKRGFQDVDAFAVIELLALAHQACETSPQREHAVTAAVMALNRAGFYSVQAEPVQTVDDMAQEAGEGIVPQTTPFNEALARAREPDGHTAGLRAALDDLSEATGSVIAKMPETASRPYRSGAELFGELMLQYNGNYDALQGTPFPEDWSLQERQNYIEYKRTLEARHAAARQHRGWGLNS